MKTIINVRRRVREAILASSLFAAVALSVALATAPAQAAELQLQVNGFAGATNLPVWVAQHEGLFAKRGLNVALSAPRGSVDQFKGLQEGRYPLVITAFDNVIAYRSGQGAAEVGTIADLTAVMGVDQGLLTLVGSPGIRTLTDLKGQTLAVDAIATGFSFALRELLRNAGLQDSDYTLAAFGNSASRWQAMQDKKAAAALLTLPADLEAMDKGATALATVAASFGGYLGNVVAVRSGWAEAHAAEMKSFLGAMNDAIAWLLVPEHKARAIEILHGEMPALDADKLERAYRALMDARQGLIRNDGQIPAGARTVLSLHSKYAGDAQKLQDVANYFDTRFYKAAVAPMLPP